MNAKAYMLPRPSPLQRDAAMIFASGFLATLAMTSIMYVLPLIGVGQVDLLTWTTRLFAEVDLPTWAARAFADDLRQVAALGVALHLFLGFGYAWLFADQVEPRLQLGPLRAGLLFGGVLWLFAQAVAGSVRVSARPGSRRRQPACAPGVRRDGRRGVWLSLGREVSMSRDWEEVKLGAMPFARVARAPRVEGCGRDAHVCWDALAAPFRQRASWSGLSLAKMASGRLRLEME